VAEKGVAEKELKRLKGQAEAAGKTDEKKGKVTVGLYKLNSVDP
jgi:hypothetical protein